MTKPQVSLPIAVDKVAPSGQGWVHFFELRNATGYSRRERYADALAVQCWPSRGLGCVGFEKKVTRSDWLRELKQPDKSAPIQRYCRHWWVVTPPELVKPEELPATWGLIEQKGKSAKVIVQAPELEPEGPGWPFLCSVLRQRAATDKQLRSAAREEGRQQARDAKAEERVMQLQEQLRDATHEASRFRRAVEMKDRDIERMVKQIRRFEEITGTSWSIFVDAGMTPRVAHYVRFAAALLDADLLGVSASLSNAAQIARELAEQLDVLSASKGKTT